MSIKKNKKQKDIHEDFINDIFNDISLNSCSFKLDLTKNILSAKKKINIKTNDKLNSYILKNKGEIDFFKKRSIKNNRSQSPFKTSVKSSYKPSFKSSIKSQNM